VVVLADLLWDAHRSAQIFEDLAQGQGVVGDGGITESAYKLLA